MATVAISILIVNGYNYLCGWREWLLKDFFFPMFEPSYMSGFLEVDMPLGNHAWVYVLILFGSLLLGSLYETGFVHGKSGIKSDEGAETAPLMMTVAMLGLCSFSYYANRAAYFNLDIIVQLAGIAVCMVWKRCRKNLFRRSGTREACGKAIVGYVSLVLTLVLAVEAVLFSAPVYLRKVIHKHYDARSYQQACVTLQETIPENTFAFGGGISFLYAELGWDTIGHYRDMSDLKLGGGMDIVNAIVEDVLEQDSFVVYMSSHREEEVVAKILEAEPGFAVEKEIELNGETLRYYVRTDG